MSLAKPKIYLPDPTAYGGELRKLRKGRVGHRRLDFGNTMHLVLRSTQAKGDWSFTRKKNRNKIDKILSKFAALYSVKVLSMAYVGNHLHFHLKLSTRQSYCKFIKAVTSAIVMAITGVNKFKSLTKAFWDLRPFTRIVFGLKGRQILEKYIQANQLEGQGWNRVAAKEMIKNEYGRWIEDTYDSA